MFDQKLHIQIDAKAIFNKESITALCIKMPTVTKTILVPYMGFDQVIIEKF
jgi:hypothetical protein